MKKLLLFAVVALLAQPGRSQIISTIAGNGSTGFSGDGGAATACEFQYPACIALDAANNVYVSDHYDHRIRKVTATGLVSTVAGNGTPGYGGDGAAATAAQLKDPTDIAVDGAGNLYICDCSNKRIRKVGPAGIITTFAGTGTAGYSGDGGPATAAQINGAYGIAIDGSGNVYITDVDSGCVRKINTSGIISRYAGNGSSGYSGDGGQATAAQLGLPYGITFDGSGNLYIADDVNNCIRKVATTGIITTFAGTGIAGFSGDGGAATAAQLNTPYAVAADGSGNIYITDLLNHRIRKVTTSGTISTIAGTGTSGFSGDGGPATAAQLSNAIDVEVAASGVIYIADASNKRVRKIGAASTYASALASGLNSSMQVFPSPNHGSFTISWPSASNEGTPITITNTLGQKVMEFNLQPNKEMDVKLNVPAGIYFITGIANGERVATKIVVE